MILVSTVNFSPINLPEDLVSFETDALYCLLCFTETLERCSTTLADITYSDCWKTEWLNHPIFIIPPNFVGKMFYQEQMFIPLILLDRQMSVTVIQQCSNLAVLFSSFSTYENVSSE